LRRGFGGRGWRLEFLAADAPAEHVVGPGLVGEDHGQEDDDDDGHHLERVPSGGCVVHGEDVRRVGGGDHHVGVQVGEDRQDARRDGDGGGGEGEALAVLVDQPDGGNDGEQGEQLDHVEEERGAGGDVGPDDEAGDGGAGEGGYAAGYLPGPLTHVAGGLQAQERRAVQQADQDQGDPGPQGVGLEQVPEGAGVVLGRVDGQSVQQSGQGHADQQRGQQAADGEQHVPGAAPAGRVAFAAVLEGHTADDQGGQQQDQREIVGREHRRVPARERGEHAGPGHDQPDLVAVPQRPDRV